MRSAMSGRHQLMFFEPESISARTHVVPVGPLSVTETRGESTRGCRLGVSAKMGG